MAAGFWGNFWRWFGREKGGAAGAAAGTGSFSGVTRWGRPPPRGSAQLLEAYGSNPRLRAVVERVVQAVAATPWRPHRIAQDKAAVAKLFGRGGRRTAVAVLTKLRQFPELRVATLKRLTDEGIAEPIDGHPALDLLNFPNPQLTSSEVKQTIQMHLELIGESFIVLERGSRSGAPAELWPVPPPWVTDCPRPGADYFRVRYPDGTFRLIDPKDVIWLKYPNPADPYGRGCGVGSSLNNELDADEFAAQTTTNYFWNDATPSMIVSYKGVGSDEVDSAKARWLLDQQGYKRARLPRFTNADVTVQQLSNSLVDMNLVQLREFLRDIVRESYGVPPELIGDTKASNRATVTQAQKLFGLNVLIPRLDKFEDMLNNVLMPQFGGSEDVVLLYENPLPEDLDSEAQAATTAPWALNIDQWRERIGEPPLPKGGDLHMVPFNLTPMDLTKLAEQIAEKPDAQAGKPENGPTEDENKPSTGAGGEANGGGQQGGDGGTKPPAPEAGQQSSKGAKVLPLRRKEEQQDERQHELREVLDALDGDDMAGAMTPLWRDQVSEWIAHEMETLGAGAQLDVVGRLAQEHVREMAGDRIAMVTDTTRSALGETLAEGLKDGDTLPAMVGRVRTLFDDASGARAELIARTETGRSSNWAIHAGQKLSGIKEREWVANRDSRTRDTHSAMDGQTVGIDASFKSPAGGSAQYPGGFGDAAEDCNCRCTSSAVVRDDDEGDTEQRGVRRMDTGAVWKAYDRRLTAWERAAMSTVRQGFAKQERRVMAALTRVLGKSVKRGVR